MKQWIKNARHFPLPNNKRCADQQERIKIEVLKQAHSETSVAKVLTAMDLKKLRTQGALGKITRRKKMSVDIPPS